MPYHAETTIQWRLLTRYVMPIFQAATKPSEHLKAWMGLCDDGPTLRQDFHKAEQPSSPARVTAFKSQQDKQLSEWKRGNDNWSWKK